MQELTDGLPSSNAFTPQAYQDLKKLITESAATIAYDQLPDKFKLTFDPAHLKNILKAMKDGIIRDYLILGHGITAFGRVYEGEDVGAICGTTPKNIKTVLRYFNTMSQTGIVSLKSCYLGGRNLNLLEFSQSGAFDDYNFTLMVFSTTDVTVVGDYNNFQQSDRTFFDQAARLEDKGKGLNNLWQPW